jgi:hypothetical protein
VGLMAPIKTPLSPKKSGLMLRTPKNWMMANRKCLLKQRLIIIIVRKQIQRLKGMKILMVQVLVLRKKQI